MTPPKLLAAIEAFNVNDISTMLRQAGIRDLPKSKDDKSRLWAKQMADPARIQAALARLKPRPRRALELLQAMDVVELRTSRYHSLLERSGITQAESTRARQGSPWANTRPETAPDPATFEEVLANLLLNGLIWSHGLPDGAQSNARVNFGGGRFVYIPAEIAAHLPPALPKERALPQVTHVIEASARTCQRDLYLVWSAAREEPLWLVSSGLLGMAELKRIAKQLLIPETIEKGTKESNYRRIFFLRRLLTAVNLLKYQSASGQLQAKADPGFLAAAPGQRVRASFESWRNGAWWNELWTTYVQGRTRASGSPIDFAPPRIGEARRTVLDTLINLTRKHEKQRQPADLWISVDELADTLRDRNEEFLVDRSTAEAQAYSYRYSYYSSTSFSPYMFNQLMWQWETYAHSEEDGWNGVERVFIEAVLTEGLYWLGLVDLGYAQPAALTGGKAPAGLLAVRLTDMGRWLLLDAAQPMVPEETGRVVLQPNFHIFAFDPISDSVLARLDSFANRLNAERAIEYEVNQESVYRAQLAGQAVPEIVAWLEQVTGAPLPQNVARSLAEWHAAFERIVVRAHVGWVEAASPELIEALLADPRLQKAVIKRATPTSVIVRSDKIGAIEQALLAAGELPSRAARADQAQRGSIVVAEDGTVRPAHAASSLYVHGALQPFTERTQDGWRITAACVARAAAGGMDAAAILASLASMAAGSIPDALAARIKAWSKHYGSAHIATVTLIEFRDQETLDELLQSPALADLLKPFHPKAKLGLAVVAAEDLEQLRRLLAERGVDVVVAMA